MFKNKDIKLIFSKKAYEKYKSIKEEKILNSIKQKISNLKKDPQYGIHIEKKKIPKKYVKKYEINNLWKINLSLFWRLTYTIKADDTKIILFIIDIVDHKEYNKIFNYKK